MGAKNSKFEQSIASSDTTTTTEHQNSSNPALYQKPTPAHSPHHSNLVKKFKRSFSPSPSEHSFSERIDPYSDSSVSSFQKKTKKLLSKKKKDTEKSRQNSISIDSGGERMSMLSATNTVEYLETLDPMTAAAERLSARYDETHERKRTYSFSAMQRQLERLDYNQDVERNLNMPQPTITSTITAGTGSTTNSSRSSTQVSLSKDVHPKINEEDWLNTKCASSSLAQQQQQGEKITSQEIVLDLFMGHSNESDRRKEKDRQQRMHYLLKHIWKGIHRSKLDNPTTIVNWCCGIGVWDMEMALLFPEAKVIGIDFEGAILSNLQHDIPNLEFRHTVIRNSCTGLESFEPNSVDYIMMRDVWLINAPVHTWKAVLKEAFRILKPGGWIEVVEHKLKIESLGPKLKQLDNYFDVFFEQLDIDRSICTQLGGFLDDAGFVQVDESAATVPLGEWSATPSLKEIGYLNRDVLERRIRSLSKWVSRANGLKEAEFLKIVNDTLEEETELQHSYMDWESYTARKPPVPASS